MFQQFWWIYIIAVILLGSIIVNWTITAKLYGSISAKLIMEMVKFGLMGVKRYRVYIGAGFMLVALCNAISPGFILPFPFIIWLAAGLHALSRVCIPPAVLLLSSSWADTVKLITTVERAVFPLRVVHLLDTYLDQQVPDAYRHETLREGSLRTYNPQNWQLIVDRLTESVPIIVVDTRIDTPALIEEARKLLETNQAHKTIFIINNDGSSPTLDRLKPLLYSSIIMANEERVPYLLRSLIRH
jgi:hypothetical protein